MKALSRVPNVAVSLVLMSTTFLAGCSQAQKERGPAADIRVGLSEQGLPPGFFQAEAEKCAGQIIGYRFVVWLNNDNVAVGFNISPNCRQAPGRKVDGLVRILLFDLSGTLRAKRDIPYLADGYGEIVADGKAGLGPGGSLLFEFQSVNLDSKGTTESKSGVLLLDRNLKDIAHIDRFLEQTTFVHHALIFQDGFVASGPRIYSVLDGAPPVEIAQWTQDWPVGTMDRKFGEHEIAYMLCQQELRPHEYSSSNIIVANAKRHCQMTSEAKDQTSWTASSSEGTATIVGILADGGVVGQIATKGQSAGRVVIWRRDQPEEELPWVPNEYSASVQSATADMSRYAALAFKDTARCVSIGGNCGGSGRFMVFDRKSRLPIVNRAFPENGRAALSPDGRHYASFEAGELRIYSLPM